MSDAFGDWDPAAHAYHHNIDPLDILDEAATGEKTPEIAVSRAFGNSLWHVTVNGSRWSSCSSEDGAWHDVAHLLGQLGGRALVTLKDDNGIAVRAAAMRDAKKGS
jgi:hypothetical protein